MKWCNRSRWGDNDHNWGPFTYSHDGNTSRLFAVELTSQGDDEDESGDCTLCISAFGHTIISTLPPVVRPHRKKIYPISWDAETIQRLGRNWYYDIHPRRYGFSFYRDSGVGSAVHLSVHYGVSTHDSSTDQQWGYFLPWTDWCHVRHSLYGLDGEHFHTERDGGPYPAERYDRMQEARGRCPTRTFAFRDFDGEYLTVETRIEEREWRLGTGWFRWLSVFSRPKTSRSLDLRFSGETGERKGSWKGGTTGHAITMLPGELHEPAFRRYCTENHMTFVGEVE